MNYTYDDYGNMISRVRNSGYDLCFYVNYKKYERPCILRHDIDFSIMKALEMAEYEWSNGINSTYFVLLTSKMYNALSADSLRLLKRISSLGHRIGLHYDESRYPLSMREGGVLETIIYEKNLLEHYLGYEIKAVSMHEPSIEFIKSNLAIPGMVNTYGDEFFNGMLYCSDSRRNFRVDIDDFIQDSKKNMECRF